SHTGCHQYAIQLCHMPYKEPGMDMFPGFSIVGGSGKAPVDADENSTSGSFKNAAYPRLMKIFEYRRPYTCSVCFFQIYTPVIVDRTPACSGAHAAVFIAEIFFRPKRSRGICCIVIEPVSDL